METAENFTSVLNTPPDRTYLDPVPLFFIEGFLTVMQGSILFQSLSASFSLPAKLIFYRVPLLFFLIVFILFKRRSKNFSHGFLICIIHFMVLFGSVC